MEEIKKMRAERNDLEEAIRTYRKRKADVENKLKIAEQRFFDGELSKRGETVKQQRAIGTSYQHQSLKTRIEAKQAFAKSTYSQQKLKDPVIDDATMMKQKKKKNELGNTPGPRMMAKVIDDATTMKKKKKKLGNIPRPSMMAKVLTSDEIKAKTEITEEGFQEEV